MVRDKEACRAKFSQRATLFYPARTIAHVASSTNWNRISKTMLTESTICLSSSKETKIIDMIL